MIPLGYAQATFRFGGTGLPNGAACTLGLKNETALDPVGVAALLATAVDDEDLMVHVSANVVLEEVLVKFGPDVVGPSGAVSVTQPGQDADAAAAPNVAWLVRKTSVAGGPRNRGRLYWPGPPQAKVNADGTVLAATLLTLQAQWDGFWDALIAVDLAPVILHSDESIPAAISDFQVDGRVATQRRRLRR